MGLREYDYGRTNLSEFQKGISEQGRLYNLAAARQRWSEGRNRLAVKLQMMDAFSLGSTECI